MKLTTELDVRVEDNDTIWDIGSNQSSVLAIFISTKTNKILSELSFYLFYCDDCSSFREI